jgi:proteic killer suppression protein
MEISFRKRKLEKIFNDEQRLVREYGRENADKIIDRMFALKEASNLDEIPTDKPYRCHQLDGDRKGEFAVDLKHPFRLVFEPDHDPVPLKDDGGIDKEAVTDIVIIEVSDYH